MENYTKISHLGSGSFGTVDLYEEKSTKRLYAIKKIEKTPESLQFISRELSILDKLNHYPNIVSHKEKFTSSQIQYIVFEYCESGTLEDYLSTHNPIHPKQKISFIQDIIRAVKQIHKNRMIHRDIKPSNFLVTNGVVKCSDFGISRELLSNGNLTCCGTPENMAPEMFKIEKYDFKVDVWALGVVVYQILTGNHPFPATNYKDLLELINTPLDFTTFTEDEKEFLSKSLEPNPHKRATLDALISTQLVQTSLKPLFSNLEQLLNYLKQSTTRLSKIVQLSICLYFLTEILYSKPTSQYLSLIKNIMKDLSWPQLNNTIGEEILSSILQQSNLLNEQNQKFSSLLLHIHKRLNSFTNFASVNKILSF